jgi:hypothetical protein
MSVCVARDLDGHHGEAAVTHAAFSHDLRGKTPDIGCGSAQKGDFQTAVMVEIHRGRGHHEIVMLAPCIGKALRQIANLVFVNIDEGSDTILALAGLVMNVVQTGPYEVSKGLRTALIAARLDEVADLGCQLIVQSYRNALHDKSPFPMREHSDTARKAEATGPGQLS